MAYAHTQAFDKLLPATLVAHHGADRRMLVALAVPRVLPACGKRSPLHDQGNPRSHSLRYHGSTVGRSVSTDFAVYQVRRFPFLAMCSGITCFSPQPQQVDSPTLCISSVIDRICSKEYIVRFCDPVKAIFGDGIIDSHNLLGRRTSERVDLGLAHANCFCMCPRT